jgi:hypothetical protein
VKKVSALSLAVFVLSVFAFSTSAYADSPTLGPTGFGSSASSNAGAIQLQPLSSFITSLPRGNAQQTTGVYVPSVFAYKVMQQPGGMATYISITRNTVTQFALAAQYGTVGLLAHDYLSGALFYNLAIGQEVDIVNGNGAVRSYRVAQIRHFQALNPYDPYSSFVDMDNRGAQLSSTDLFLQMYGGGNKVVFMTCIYMNGSPAGGRLFVIATPV